MASFNHFLDVFSAQDERINFSSFACCQASWDTSLEYPQRVLSRKKYFHFIKGLGNFLGPNRKPKWPKNIFLAPESYYLHINTWNFTRSRIQIGILGISLRLSVGGVVGCRWSGKSWNVCHGVFKKPWKCRWGGRVWGGGQGIGGVVGYRWGGRVKEGL